MYPLNGDGVLSSEACSNAVFEWREVGIDALRILSIKSNIEIDINK